MSELNYESIIKQSTSLLACGTSQKLQFRLVYGVECLLKEAISA